MIRYGVCIGNDSRYEQCARPGLERIGALDRTIESRHNDSIFAAYNQIIEQSQDADALVLLHEDLEIRDEHFEKKVYETLDEDVAIIGGIGGVGVRSVRWSQAVATFGKLPGADSPNDHGGGVHDVDQVDGALLVLSPWAIAHLRFDDHIFHGFDAYDADICMQARTAGKRVRVAEFDVLHGEVPRPEPFDRSKHRRIDREFRRKWGIRPDPPKRRAKDVILYRLGGDRVRRSLRRARL